MRHRRDNPGMTDEEIAQIVREEWERPMIRANSADIDAFDYFASQGLMEPEPKSESITYAFGALVTSAMVMFIGSLVILASTVSVAWALWFALTACVLLFVATLLGTFAK
jgi:hypothetical protein